MDIVKCFFTETLLFSGMFLRMLSTLHPNKTEHSQQRTAHFRTATVSGRQMVLGYILVATLCDAVSRPNYCNGMPDLTNELGQPFKKVEGSFVK